MRPIRVRAFTLADLCILLALVGLLAGGSLTRAVARTRETAHRVRCASNLRQIGQAIQLYARVNAGALPRAMDDGGFSPPSEYTNPKARDPFQIGAPGPNDVTAALFLLVRETEIGPEVFVCPTAPGAVPWDYGGAKVTQVSNFPGRQYLSYSFLNVYPAPAATAAGFGVTLVPNASFAIAADMNPGGGAVMSVTPTSTRHQVVPANSRNHNGDAQNVLYADGHVEFQNTPFCGQLRTPASGVPFRDNIYTFGASWGGATGVGVRGSPVDALDSVLLPTAQDGPPPVLGASPRELLLRGIAAAFILGVAGLVLMTWRRRKPPVTPPPV